MIVSIDKSVYYVSLNIRNARRHLINNKDDSKSIAIYL